MSAFALWRLFHRPGLRGSAGHTSMLAIIAFAAATTIFLTVLGGVHGFIWRASADHTVACAFDFGACRPDTVAAWKRQISDPTSLAQFSTAYVALAVFACMLLVVPFVALAGSAARLAASRRDARLAALRLAGATTGQVVRLTALDAAGQALIGALIGIAGYCALMPAVMLIPFQEQRFTFEQLWVGPLALVITLAGVAILALISSLVTLRRVAITPLGVTSRTATALPSGTRMVLFVVVVVVAMIVFKNPAMLAQAGQAVMYGVIIGFMLLCFALVNLIGTWVITARAKAFTVFIRDIGTGGILTLVFAAVLAAVSSGVMQAGSVYDQAGEYRMLVLEGTDVKTLNRARFIEVLTPLNIVVIVAGGCSMLLMAPLFAASMTEPATLASFFGGLVLCYALVSIGAFASNHVAASLNLTDYRADD